MLISRDYLLQNRLLHDSEATYGTSGWQYADAVLMLKNVHSASTILDYGCGKGRFGQAMWEKYSVGILEYDPAIDGKDGLPAPADIVVCGDVMEHIEPDCVNDVINHIRGLTLKCAYWVIATRPAAKHLPDGRNCHLIVEDAQWWALLIEDFGFEIETTSHGRKGEAIFTTTPR